MKKTKYFKYSRFPPEAIVEARALMDSLASQEGRPVVFSRLEVQHDEAEWSYENFDEFISDYRRFKDGASFWAKFGLTQLAVSQYNYSDSDRYACVSVEAEHREQIHKIFEIFEKHKSASVVLPPEVSVCGTEGKIFIGHGRSEVWRDLRDHLTEKHSFKVVSYESGSRSGHVIRDILEDMAASSSFALLVMTGEDQQADGVLRARQNVVHEAGLFQGRLGFARALVLLEDGVERFSNLDGIQYIPFSKGNIRETFGDVLAAIRRELEN